MKRIFLFLACLAFLGSTKAMALVNCDIYLTLIGNNGNYAVNVIDEVYDSGVLAGSTTWGSHPAPPMNRTFVFTSFNQPVGRVHKIRIQDVANNTNFYASPTNGITVSSGSPQVMDFTGAFYATSTICVTNKDALYNSYGLFHSGVMQGNPVLLGPGKNACWTISTTDVVGWVVNRLDVLYNNEGQIVFSNAVPVATFNFGGTAGAADSAPVQNQYTPPTNAAQGSINWTNTISQSNTNVSKDATLQTGFSALFDAASKENGFLQQIESDVNGSKNNVSTNFAALRSDLAGVSNVLGSLTNKSASSNESVSVANTNAQVSAGLGASNTVIGVLNASTNGLHSPLTGGNSFSPVSGFWTLHATMRGTSYTMDLDPLHNAGIADIAARIRALLVYFISLLFFFAITKRSLTVMESAAHARQATSAGTTILGTNANSPLALGMAALITVSILTIPTFFAAWLTQNGVITIFGTNPFTAFSSGSNMATAVLSLADGFIPLGYIVFYLVTYFGYCILLEGLFQGVLAAVRFMVG